MLEKTWRYLNSEGFQYVRNDANCWLQHLSHRMGTRISCCNLHSVAYVDRELCWMMLDYMESTWLRFISVPRWVSTSTMPRLSHVQRKRNVNRFLQSTESCPRHKKHSRWSVKRGTTCDDTDRFQTVEATSINVTGNHQTQLDMAPIWDHVYKPGECVNQSA